MTKKILDELKAYAAMTHLRQAFSTEADLEALRVATLGAQTVVGEGELPDDYRPSHLHLSNSEIRATGILAGGAVANIARELLELRNRMRAAIAQRDEANRKMELAQQAFTDLREADRETMVEMLAGSLEEHQRANTAEAKLAEGKPEPGELERLFLHELNEWDEPMTHKDVMRYVNTILARLRSLPSEPAGQQRGTVENEGS